MKRRRLQALERLLRPRPRPTCPCLLTFCPQMGETIPSLEVVCNRCGRWRDPQTAHVLEYILVETREEVEAFGAKQRRQQR